MLERPERSVGLSLHTGLAQNIFCHDPVRARTLHGSLIAWALSHAGNVALFEQGVQREYDIADRALPFDERGARAEETLALIGNPDGVTPYALLSRMVSVKSVEEWIFRARDYDAIIGFRLHGNTVALLQGIPCHYYVYDSRLAEFCDVYGLPFQDLADDWVDPAVRLAAHDWQMANARIRRCYEEMKAFYQENGFLTHLA